MKIDINCDVGEGIAHEHLLMPYISSCNIACGGHFGDVNSIDKTIELALKNKVLIGAHPSFPDKENFGRKILNISKNKLHQSIQNQMDLFLKRLAVSKAKLHHIKPHGALYNLISIDKIAAIQFVESIQKYMNDVFLYVPYNSKIEEVALAHKIKIKYEAFADRNYNANLTLVARNQQKAIITKPIAVLEHVSKMVFEKKVHTVLGIDKKIKADTFCIHGDHDNSVIILQYLSKELLKKGIVIG